VAVAPSRTFPSEHDAGGKVATLHIEHPITDLDTWLGAFQGFAEARHNAGVIGERVQQPVDDDRYIVVDLDFTNPTAANAFKDFLETVVWQSKELSPGLDGAPTARVQEDVRTAR
jgi:hypothetical protein